MAGLIVGINAASGTNVPGLGPLDHYLCYSSAATSTPGITNVKPFPQTPVAAWLQNQFGSVLGKVGSMQRHCNPVQKTTPDGLVTPINRPNDHLACFSFTGNRHPTPPVVNVTNQFSPSNAAGPVAVPLQVGALQSLCLPSFKSLTAANVQTGAPDDLDHYSCYKVAYPKGSATKFVAPPTVQLDDQFSRLLVPAQSLTATVLTPQSLCLPTIKIINPNPFVAPPTFQNLIDKNDHLVCFGVRITSPSPFVTPTSVFDSNQFGVGQVSITGAKQLCVPSLKDVPPPPPTTTTTIAGVTTTTCDPAAGNCGTTTTTAPCTVTPNCSTMPPVFTKSFGATVIAVGGTTSLTFSISNPNPGLTLTGISVNDNLPGGLVVATPNGLVPGCGGVFNAPSGGPLVSMNGGSLAPLASCSFKVDVKAIAPSPNGLATNITDPLVTDQTGPGPQATATIHVG